jgi:hypothetical protein
MTMKKLALAIALLPLFGCAAGNDDSTSARPDNAMAPIGAPDAQKMLTVQIKGASVHALPALLNSSGVSLEVCPALSNHALEVDSAGRPLGQVLEEVAAAVSARLTYGAGTYRILPIVAASEGPLPKGDGQGQPELMGALSPEDIKRVISTNAILVRQCYETALTARHPKLDGKLAVHFVIEATGKVRSADINRGNSTLEDGGLEACILDVVRAMVFPAPTGGGIVEVHYPFVFAAGTQAHAGSPAAQLSWDQLTAAVEKNAGSVAPCLKQARDHNEIARGQEYRFLVTLGVLPDGSLKDPAVKAKIPDGEASPDLRACIVNAMRKWRFPAASNETPEHGFLLGPFKVE